MCTVLLHNFLITCQQSENDEETRIRILADRGANDYAFEEDHFINRQPFQVRQTLTDYFVSPAGSVHWQWEHL